MSKAELRTKIERLQQNGTSSSLKINSTICVNSKWIASWLARPKQEHCQCVFECKIRINYKNREYVVTKKELANMISNQKLLIKTTRSKPINIEELKKYLEEEISYFKELKSKDEITEKGKIRLETFEHIFNKINSNN